MPSSLVSGTKLIDIIRAYYRCFKTRDRQGLERILTPDFRHRPLRAWATRRPVADLAASVEGDRRGPRRRRRRTPRALRDAVRAPRGGVAAGRAVTARSARQHGTGVGPLRRAGARRRLIDADRVGDDDDPPVGGHAGRTHHAAARRDHKRAVSERLYGLYDDCKGDPAVREQIALCIGEGADTFGACVVGLAGGVPPAE